MNTLTQIFAFGFYWGVVFEWETKTLLIWTFEEEVSSALRTLNDQEYNRQNIKHYIWKVAVSSRSMLMTLCILVSFKIACYQQSAAGSCTTQLYK